MKTATLFLRAIAWCVGSIIRTVFALIVIAGLAFANYNMTIPGTGTSFGSIVVSTVHYAQMLSCDPTTPANCGAVKTASSAATTDLAQVVSDPVVASALNTVNTNLGTLNTTAGNPLAAQSTHTVNIGAVDSISPYPAGAIPITASATGTTAATAATLAASATGKTTYICGYSIRANATAATTVTDTVTGVVTATLSHILWVAPAASGLGVDEQIFSPCIPGSASNTAIAVVSGAPGSGGNVSVTANGYQL